MPRVVFAPALQRYVAVPDREIAAPTVGAALAAVFGEHPSLRSYVLDDQGQLRRHVAVFIDGQRIRDRVGLSDPVAPESEVFVVQALSGG